MVEFTAACEPPSVIFLGWVLVGFRLSICASALRFACGTFAAP